MENSAREATRNVLQGETGEPSSMENETFTKSQTKHYLHKKPDHPYRVFRKLLITEMAIPDLLQCHYERHDGAYARGSYYELTLYMDLRRNKSASHSLSCQRGDQMTMWLLVRRQTAQRGKQLEAGSRST